MKDELAKIGTETTITLDGLHILVCILDVRQAFGRIDYQIQPVAGSGTKWVSSEKLMDIRIHS